MQQLVSINKYLMGVTMETQIKCFTDCVTRRRFIKQIGKASLVSAVAGSGIFPMGCAENEDTKEIHKSEIIQFQNTCKPRINELLGVENHDRFCEAALREYDSFASQIPMFEDNNNKSNFIANGPFMLSHYRALLGKLNLNQKEALDVLRQITNFKHRKKFENQSVIMKFFFLE
jgi:hypothetical protein